MTLFQPVWLLLLIPLGAAWVAWPPPNQCLRIVRALIFLFVVLAICQLAVKLPDRAGTVIVVADRSESMPKNAAASQKELIDLLHHSMAPRDLMGVISFGRSAAVEQPPQRAQFGGFTAKVGTEHSDLNGALEEALGLIPPEGSGRILVLSDGRWTGLDPASAAARAAGRGIPIDYRLLARPQANDLAIRSFVVPDSALPGQAYFLSAWVQSSVKQDIQYQLRRGTRVVASGARSVLPGLTRVMLRDRAPQGGVCDYTFTVHGSLEDAVPENNEAHALMGIEGARPVLVVSAAGENSGLFKQLRNGGVDVRGKTPGQCRWSIDELAQYAAVIIENVSANQIGPGGMETLASWVETTGSGLMMTGGQKSYGPGGYFKSPLDRILPVSMEMRREHRKLSLAIAVALDRSGSMALPASGGRTKMDLADLGTVQVLDLLAPSDEFGAIAVDTAPHIIVDLDTVDKNSASRGKILAIDSMGGGIYIYEALAAAAKMLTGAKAQTRHIILFADAADSEHPADYPPLIEKCREAGMTVSVIGLGTEADVDADLLKDIAARGGGNCYFTDSPEEIPRLFAQDTFTVARSTFVDQPTPMQFTAGFSTLGLSPGVPPSMGGYNLCYIRPEANLAAVTTDEYQAPAVASWNVGNGRVLCFAGEADGKFSGPLAAWDQAGEFYSTLARWTAGKPQALPDDLLLTQQVQDGICVVQLHLDPERQSDPFSSLPRIRILHGLPGETPGSKTAAMEWKTADLLEAAITIDGRETLLNTVEIPGQQAVALTPVCLPYSPEFAPEQPGRGPAALAQLASATGGKERLDISQTWSDLQVGSRYVELTPWLFVSAAIMFLLEILERRTGWVSRVVIRRTPPLTGEAKPVTKQRDVSKSGQRRVDSTPVSVASAGGQMKSGVDVRAPEEQSSQLDALKEARERASRRTGR